MPSDHHASRTQTLQPLSRARPGSVALETTLLLHGVPRAQASLLQRDLGAAASKHGAFPAFVGLFRGVPTVGLSESEMSELLGSTDPVPKANTANLGVLIHRRSHGATTVATTMELAAHAGIRVFATGGIGGVHPGYGEHLDISADLAAFTRFPVAVVGSGVKSILDVGSTREALETLGVPVVGFGTDRFPAFYLRDSESIVDARFDDAVELAAFLHQELSRTGRGVLVANPIPVAEELDAAAWGRWLAEARARAAAQGITGRALTPFLLSTLHEVSKGRTLQANIALVRSNTELAARIAVAMRALGA